MSNDLNPYAALSKPGKFGTLHLYSVENQIIAESAASMMDYIVNYADGQQPEPQYLPVKWHTYAYNPKDAEAKFYDSTGGEGYTVVRVTRVRNTSARRSR